MKSILNFVILFLFFNSVLYAQEEKNNILWKFGISATLEKNSDILTDGVHRDTKIGFSKILFPVIFKSFLKIQPEFAYHSQDSRDTNKYESWKFGLGIFYYYPYNKIVIYSGPRFGLEKLRSSFYSDNGEYSTSNFFNYGIILGTEYFLSNIFSVGSEFQINKYILRESYSEDFEVSHLTVVPVLYLSLYIN